MTLGELATRPAVTVPQTATVEQAAQQMLEQEIGFLVVVDDEGRATGVLTDRDIVVRTVAFGRAAELPVGEVMSRHPAQVGVDDTVASAARLMADRQCRRVMVTDPAGKPVGVLSLDDLLRETGEDLAQIARAVRGPRHSHPV